MPHGAALKALREFASPASRSPGEAARSAQHAAGDFDNRHVVLCAASAHVIVSVFYQTLTPPTGLGLLALLRGGLYPGRAARGSVVPRKMACRPTAGERIS